MRQADLNKSVKEALARGLRENREILRDLMAEVIEDLALAGAIRAGEKSKRVTKQAVLSALKAGK